jgi:hypothetical protein
MFPWFFVKIFVVIQGVKANSFSSLFKYIFYLLTKRDTIYFASIDVHATMSFLFHIQLTTPFANRNVKPIVGLLVSMLPPQFKYKKLIKITLSLGTLEYYKHKP